MIPLDIVNLALAEIGVSPLVSLSTDNDVASLCSKIYDSSLNYLLSLHNWYFATKKVNISYINEINDEYKYEFVKPSDVVKIVSVETKDGYEVEYAIEGDKILSNANVLRIKYVYYPVDSSLFPVYFIEALKHYIASSLSVKLMNDTNAKNLQFELFTQKLNTAKHIESQTVRPTKSVIVSNWLEARY